MKATKAKPRRAARSLDAMVRPRPQNLAATVFVFESTSKPYTTHVCYLDQASCYADNPKWKHTATIDPARWIEHLLNHPEDRDKHIEGVMYMPNDQGQPRREENL